MNGRDRAGAARGTGGKDAPANSRHTCSTQNKMEWKKRLIFSQNFENHGAALSTCGTVDHFRNVAFQAE
jgi:hypothetical protein